MLPDLLCVLVNMPFIFCCGFMVSSLHVCCASLSVLFRFSVFILVDLPFTGSDVLRLPSIVQLSFSSFTSVCFCFMYFEALLLVAYMFIIVISF